MQCNLFSNERRNSILKKMKHKNKTKQKSMQNSSKIDWFTWINKWKKTREQNDFNLFSFSSKTGDYKIKWRRKKTRNSKFKFSRHGFANTHFAHLQKKILFPIWRVSLNSYCCWFNILQFQCDIGIELCGSRFLWLSPILIMRAKTKM